MLVGRAGCLTGAVTILEGLLPVWETPQGRSVPTSLPPFVLSWALPLLNQTRTRRNEPTSAVKSVFWGTDRVGKGGERLNPEEEKEDAWHYVSKETVFGSVKWSPSPQTEAFDMQKLKL